MATSPATDRFQVRRDVVPGVDAVLAESDRCFARHTHDQFGVGVILDGAQLSASGRGQVFGEAGDVITVNPGEVHDGAAIGRRARRWSMLYFAPDLVAAYGAEIGEGRWGAREFDRPVMSDRRLAGQVRSLIAAMEAGDGPGDGAEPDMRREERALAVMAGLLGRDEGRDDVEGGPQGGAAPPVAIRRVLARMEEDPAAVHALSDLAALSGLSRFQVVRGVSRATGLTPHAYLLQCRVRLARCRIRAGASLADAAAESGFADQSHMSRLFKRCFGYPPGAFAAS